MKIPSPHFLRPVRFSAKPKTYSETQVKRAFENLLNQLSPADQAFARQNSFVFHEIAFPIGIYVQTPDEVAEWNQKLLKAGAKRATVQKTPCFKYQTIPVIVQIPATRGLV